MEHSTIAAIATPQGSGGIGIIRISGKASVGILSSLFRFSRKHISEPQDPAVDAFYSHRLYLGHILDPTADTLIDEVLVVVMRAPRSYTTEDVVEIQSHSGYVVLNKILSLILGLGARLAEPGEFTRRAFMHGRIDLTQAEAVIDVINAKTKASLDIAADQLEGGLGKRIEKLRSRLIELLAQIEAEIDFPGDIDETLDCTAMSAILENQVIAPLEQLIKGYEHNHYFRDGIRMAIVGRPNVGKSSLLNRLTRKERAIVTEIPGTTRDTIEEMVNINGLPVILIDTAGLHDTTQRIEMMSIERTYATVQAADIVLFVIDLNQPITQEDLNVFRRLQGKTHIVVMNKVDLNNKITLPSEWGKAVAIKISALKGTNIEQLKAAIYENGIGREDVFHRASIVPNLRQADCLKRAIHFSLNGLREIKSGLALDFAAIELKDAIKEMDQILGLSYNEDVLDLIFSRFCIGK